MYKVVKIQRKLIQTEGEKIDYYKISKNGLKDRNRKMAYEKEGFKWSENEESMKTKLFR